MTVNMTGRLEKKIALVTGGGAGMGAGIVRRFAAEGATVIFTDLNEEDGRAVAAATGATFVKQDVADEAAWIATLDSIQQRHGRLDVLVNNAGLVSVGNIEDISLDVWKRTFAVNVDALFYGCRHAIRLMRKNPGGSGGSIVNIVSTSAFLAAPSQVAYGPSKAAALSLTKSIAIHCAREKTNIRCNMIHPGVTHTKLVQTMVDQSEQPEQVLAHLHGMAPMGRMGTPEDIAAAALFFASDDSRYASGAELVIDGALTSVHPGL